MKTLLVAVVLLAGAIGARAASFVVPPVGSGGVNGGLSNAYAFSAGMTVAQNTNVALVPGLSNLVLNLPATNGTVLGRGAVGTIASGALTLSNTAAIYTNAVYVNANGSAVANGSVLSNVLKSASAGSLVVVGPGDYFIPEALDGFTWLKDQVDQYWHPGARLMLESVSSDFIQSDTAAPLRVRITGHGQFSFTNDNSGGLSLTNNSDVSLEAQNFRIKADTGLEGFRVRGSRLVVNLREDVLVSGYDVVVFNPTNSIIRFKVPSASYADTLFECEGGDSANWGDIVFDVDQAERSDLTGGGVALQLGGRTTARIGSLKLNGNAIIANVGSTNGMLVGTTIICPQTNTWSLLSRRGNNTSTHLWFKNCTLDCSPLVDPVTLTNYAGTLTIFEGTTIKGGATNSVRVQANTPQTAQIIGGHLPLGVASTVTAIGSLTTVATLGGAVTLNASPFNGNLATTDDTLQEVAQKVDDLVISGGSGGTNFPPVINTLGLTNVTVGSGVRQARTFTTNASFGLNFSGTALNGETVSIAVSNHSSADIFMTNYVGSTATGVYDPTVGSNVTQFAIMAGSIRYFEFRAHTNFNNGTVRWENIGGAQKGYVVEWGTDIEATTNGATISLKTSYTNQVVSGVGGANTNFTGLWTHSQAYLDGGTTNVNFVAFMPGTANRTYYLTYSISNLTTTPRNISISSVTNRVVNMQQYYGIAPPYVLTNKHTGQLTVKLSSTNAEVSFLQYTNGF